MQRSLSEIYTELYFWLNHLDYVLCEQCEFHGLKLPTLFKTFFEHLYLFRLVRCITFLCSWLMYCKTYAKGIRNFVMAVVVLFQQFAYIVLPIFRNVNVNPRKLHGKEKSSA